MDFFWDIKNSQVWQFGFLTQSENFTQSAHCDNNGTVWKDEGVQ
jgi:hypothetical protein